MLLSSMFTTAGLSPSSSLAFLGDRVGLGEPLLVHQFVELVDERRDLLLDPDAGVDLTLHDVAGLGVLPLEGDDRACWCR